MVGALRLMLVLAAGIFFAAQGANATLLAFNAVLDGPSEDPPVPSPGTGFAQILVDDVAHTMHVHAEFSDLVAPTTVAHIHCCTAVPNAGIAGVATTTPTFPGFPDGVTSGLYDALFDLTLASFYNPAFITANGGTAATAEAALIAGMQGRRAYFNIHSTAFQLGEIRGFLQVPEPATMSLLGLVLGAALVALRRRSHGMDGIR